jgi:hypothetical protein
VDRVRHDSETFGDGPIVVFTHALFARAFPFPNCGILSIRLMREGAAFQPVD